MEQSLSKMKAAASRTTFTTSVLWRSARVAACTMAIGVLGAFPLHVYADSIIVNTTEDQDGEDDTKCSIREAIKITNDFLTIKDETVRKQRLKVGYGGCKGEGLTATIELSESVEKDDSGNIKYIKDANGKKQPVQKVYVLNKEIAIRAPVTLQSRDASFSSKVSLYELPIIQLKANTVGRLFDVADNNANATNIAVKFVGLHLKGCRAGDLTDSNVETKQLDVCEAQGGIIRNTEQLTLNLVRLEGGVAKTGGAIYNDVRNVLSTGGRLEVQYAEFYRNIAENGAAIYNGFINFSVSKSLFRRNKVLKNDASIVETRASAQTERDFDKGSGQVLNSTFYRNYVGFGVNVLSGIKVNNITMVNNTRGVHLNSSSRTGSLSNSILFNENNDCVLAADNTKAISNNLLFISGCSPSAGTSLPNLRKAGVAQQDNSLLAVDATSAVVDDTQRCALPDGDYVDYLLCPLAYEPNSPVAFFKPRIPLNINTLAQAYIVNKGRGTYDPTKDDGVVCESVDTREREANREQCDLGAVELLIPTADADRTNGVDIEFNNDGVIDLIPTLGDGQLLPSQLCEQYFGAAADVAKSVENLGYDPETRLPVTGRWLDGCVRVVKGKAPKYGEFVIDQSSNELKYLYRVNHHGVDEFEYYVATTASRFSNADNERSVLITTKIVMYPPYTFEGKTINLSGGRLGWLSALVLFGFACIRRLTTHRTNA